MSENESKSEVAQLMRRIALEYEAAERGLFGFAGGSSKHQFITARLENIGACHEQLAQLVGDKQAAHLVCDVLEHGVQAEEH